MERHQSLILLCCFMRSYEKAGNVMINISLCRGRLSRADQRLPVYCPKQKYIINILNYSWENVNIFITSPSHEADYYPCHRPQKYQDGDRCAQGKGTKAACIVDLIRSWVDHIKASGIGPRPPPRCDQIATAKVSPSVLSPSISVTTAAPWGTKIRPSDRCTEACLAR